MTHPLHGAVKAYDIRGLVAEQLTPTAVRALGAAVAEETAAGADPGAADTPLVIGHDMRASSPVLADALADGARAAGADVLLIGLCSTDQLYFVSGDRSAPGVMVTASHNPAQYNGFKICRAGARPVALDTGLAAIRDRAIALDTAQATFPTGRGTLTRADTLAEYAVHLRHLVPLDAGRPLRVVVDAGNGMAGLTVPAVLGTASGLPALPLELHGLYLELDGTFPNHDANPLDPTTLVDLQAAVREQGADVGLAFDGDADRCFVIDGEGQAVDPGVVTALVAQREIARVHAAGEVNPSVLHNLITSQIVPDVVTAAGGSAVRTRVGHSFIKAEMARTGAVFGGEHSAHYYFRDFFGADSGILAAMHVLSALGRTPPGTTLVDLVADLRRYHRSGELNSRVTDVAAATATVVATITGRHPEVTLDHLDGVTLSPPDGSWWANLRPSNTEPLLRLNVEARDAATMERVRNEVLEVLAGAGAQGHGRD